MSIAKFLRGIVEMSTLLNKQEIQFFDIINPNKQISMSDASDIVSKIMTICHEKEIENLPSDNEVAEILETIQKSTFYPIPETPVLTHKEKFLLPSDVAERGKLVPVKNPIHPHYVDIHTISTLSMSIFDEQIPSVEEGE
jgi:hypothetical protein